MRALMAICTAGLAAICCQAQLCIDHHRLIYDQRANQWLCTVPQQCFGTDYSATITIEDNCSWHNIDIDGTPVQHGTQVTFQALDGTTPHSITAYTADSTLNATLLFSCLPLLEVKATLSKEYQPATFTLHHPDSLKPLQLKGRIKWRGKTTLSNDRHKRNFHIKLEDDNGDKLNLKLLGMRDDNSWLLDGGQTDLSRIRNLVAHQLWLDMAAKPYYADREPKARSAVRGELIELIVNGQYEGIYALTEAMDRKQMRLVKFNTDSTGQQVIRGQLWKANTYTGATAFNSTKEYCDTDSVWLGFETKYPELEEVTPTDYSILYNAVHFAQTAYDLKWKRQAHLYYDLPVIRDYFIFINALLAIDNTAKNIYWAVYDRTQDPMITLAVWDLDCTVGQDWTNNPFRPQDRVGPELNRTLTNNVMGRLFVLIDDYRQGVIDRYAQLRQGPLHTDSLTCRYTDVIDHLIATGAATRESNRWDGDTDLGGHNLDWDAEKQYIADWIKRRLKFLDNNLFAQAAIETVTDQQPQQQPAAIYNLMGQRMPQHATLPPGIYIRNGQKIVIR